MSVTGDVMSIIAIPGTKYTLNVSENSITLTSPYDAATEEQIMSIYNLTKHKIVYCSKDTNIGQISLSTGKITYVTPFSSTFENGDKLQILVSDNITGL